MKKMWNFAKLRIGALLVALLLLASTTGCACAAMYVAVAEGVRSFVAGELPEATAAPLPQIAAPSVSADRKTIPFSEMAYSRPDTELLERMILSLEADIGMDDLNSLLDRYEEIRSLYNEADSMLSLCYVFYALDVTDAYYREEYAWLLSELQSLDLIMTDVSLALLERSESVREQWGEDYASAVEAGADLNSEAVQELFGREQSRAMEYDELCSTFVLHDGGKTYTFEDIDRVADADYREYIRLYDAYCAAFNQEAGAIFTDLVAIRHEIAATLGYGSYAAYGYDCYGRDYSVTEAQALHDAVKEHIVPLYEAVIMAQYELTDDAWYGDYPQDAFMEQLRAAAADFSPMIAEPLDYMLQNGLYNFTPDPNKMETSFTTYFSAFESPFLFTAWHDSFDDTGTVIHELGHYANYYHNPAVGWSVGDSLDLAEIDSQGLELLMMPYYPHFYGTAAASAALYRIGDALYAIIAGCMEDEFQQRVYATPSMTGEEMNALYLSLAEEYGMVSLYGFTGTEWALVPHTFQSPMYYISYAASMIPALELWELSRTDANKAKEAYLRILMREPYASFRDTVQGVGLSDPLDAATIQHLSEVIRHAYRL